MAHQVTGPGALVKASIRLDGENNKVGKTSVEDNLAVLGLIRCSARMYQSSTNMELVAKNFCKPHQNLSLQRQKFVKMKINDSKNVNNYLSSISFAKINSCSYMDRIH